MPRYLSHDDTLRIDLDLEEIITAFEEAHRRVAAGEGVYSPRLRLVYPPLSGNGAGRPWRQNLRILPGIVSGLGAGVRVGGSRAREGSGGSFLLLFDFDTMTPAAIISDHMVHGLRSGIPNGMAAKRLALEDARVLGVIGSGRIARWGTRAVCAVRPIERIHVFSPTPEHRRDYARAMQEELGIETSAREDPRVAVADADIVVAATNTTTGPILDGGWLKPGCTVIYNTPEEIDVETARRARIVVGLKEEIMGHLPPYEAIETLMASGELNDADISCEITDVLLGRTAGRESPEDVVAYLNPGCGIYDTAVASHFHRKAEEQGIGTVLPV